VSQVAAKKKLSIRNERVTVNAYFHEQGSVLRGDAEGFCDRFEVTLSMESEEVPEQLAQLVRLARQLCFTEKALTAETPVKVIPLVNGEPLQV